MNSEILLLAYGAVCLGMIVFNLVYSMVLDLKEQSLSRSGRRLRTEIMRQFGLLRDSGKVEAEHLAYLRRKLRDHPHSKRRWPI